MPIAQLRKVGGSVMLAVPPVFLEQLNLQPGTSVKLSLEANRLVMEPQHKPSYTLAELLAQCDPSALPDAQDRLWLDAPPVGAELL